MEDVALAVHGDADARQAAHHLVGAEAGIERLEMTHAVQRGTIVVFGPTPVAMASIAESRS